ncbi:MAG: hypothetical protein ACP5VP_05945 [Candidatus Limnocylindrales bacterium]
MVSTFRQMPVGAWRFPGHSRGIAAPVVTSHVPERCPLRGTRLPAGRRAPRNEV